MNDDFLSLFPEIEEFQAEDFDYSSDSISFKGTIETGDSALSPEIAEHIATAPVSNRYYVPTDTNFDGIADSYSIGIDINHDGIIDVLEGRSDINRDGFFDTDFRMIDLDSDGIADIVQQKTTIDYNGDGIADAYTYLEDSDSDRIADYFQHDTMYDYNGDGIVDFRSSAFDYDADGLTDVIKQTTTIDYNHDGIGDAYMREAIDAHNPANRFVSVYSDPDGDHIWEAEKSYVMQNGEIFALPEPECCAADAYQTFDPATADMENIIGDPESYIDNWHVQETGFSCAVAAQEFVIEELLGADFEEAQLRRIAVENGWLTEEGGTSMENTGKLMEYMGLTVERSLGNTFEDLCDSLSRGIHPIVGVDGDELFIGKNEELYMPGNDSNHALQVIGVDMSDPENPMVILNDSGVLNGRGAMIEKDIFMGAWEDSGCFMAEAHL